MQTIDLIESIKKLRSDMKEFDVNILAITIDNDRKTVVLVSGLEADFVRSFRDYEIEVRKDSYYPYALNFETDGIVFKCLLEESELTESEKERVKADDRSPLPS